MTTEKNQICANCGHEKAWHRLKVKKRNGENQVVSMNTRSGKGCMKTGCPCKKFKPQTPETKPQQTGISETRLKGTSQANGDKLMGDLMKEKIKLEALRGCGKKFEWKGEHITCYLNCEEKFLCPSCQKLQVSVHEKLVQNNIQGSNDDLK